LGLVGLGSTSPSANNLRFYQMDVIVDKVASAAEPGNDRSNCEDEYTETVTPLFRLIPGRAAKSYGLACARMAGVLESVLVRAGVVTRALEVGQQVPVSRSSSEHPDSGFLGMTRRAEHQVACADMIMSVVNWELHTQEKDFQKVIKYVAASATASGLSARSTGAGSESAQADRQSLAAL
jgi:DNA mismatch repair ATPase MutS